MCPGVKKPALPRQGAQVCLILGLKAKIPHARYRCGQTKNKKTLQTKVKVKSLKLRDKEKILKSREEKEEENRRALHRQGHKNDG